MRIDAWGGAVPDVVETNREVERELGLPPGWIAERTGFRLRHRVPPGISTCDLAVQACECALAARTLDAPPIDLLLLATSSPDHPLPPSAPAVAQRLGLRCGAIDVGGACAGFLYALVLACHYGNARGRSVLVIGANVISRRLSSDDRRTRAVFSDGGGAVLLVPSSSDCLLASALTSDGSAYHAVGVSAGGSRCPLTVKQVEAGEHFVRIRDGKKTTQCAIDTMADVGLQCLRQASLGPGDVDWWIPHQANAHIINETGARLGIDRNRWVSYTDDYGNSSAGTIPLNLWRAATDGRIRKGDKILLTAAGAGFLGAGALVEF
jgi:3-oxoacyl-[acyl-carrier-protein] synthase III